MQNFHVKFSLVLVLKKRWLDRYDGSIKLSMLKMETENFFSFFHNTRTRNNPMTLLSSRFRTDRRKSIFVLFV